MNTHPPCSSSRSPRSRLVIGGRMSPAQPASQLHHHRHQQQQQQPMTPDIDRGGRELTALDCNLAALCDHIQLEGFNAGAFSDVVVHAMGSTYHLHRLVLSRSSYFRNMLHGPWKEAHAPVVTLQIDDDNVNSAAISMSLAYLYGHYPKLDDSNAFRVLAAASFLDLQELCAICTDFIISELWTSNFLEYQVFAESQDYGVHGERVRKACWGYLCQSGTRELREVLPKLSSQTLQSLLTSDRLWVPNEEKRFELALYTLLAKSALNKEEQLEQSPNNSTTGSIAPSSYCIPVGHKLSDSSNSLLQSELKCMNAKDNLKGHNATPKVLDELAEGVVDYQNDFSHLESGKVQIESPKPVTYSYSSKMERSASSNSNFSDSNVVQGCSHLEMEDSIATERMVVNGSATEGPSERSTYYPFNNNMWLSGDQSREFPSDGSSGIVGPEWGEGGMALPSWGARSAGWRQDKTIEGNCGIFVGDYDVFVSIFEGSSLLYCNMSFEALLNARKQLEEMGFPCKAVNDGLWLQMLLSHKIQEVGADTCRNCCLTNISCACRQSYGCSQDGTPVGYYRQDPDRISTIGIGNMYLTDTQGEENGVYRPVRIHARGHIDGLAGIGRGSTFVSSSGWTPTRFVFSRVPIGLGNRNCQQSLGNDEPEGRTDVMTDLSGDGLTALVRPGEGVVPVHLEHADRAYIAESSNATNNIPLQVMEAQENNLDLDWENSEVSSLSLDMKTPLRHFPPFRFGVEFEDVHRLGDGQVKHSMEVFYAGSLWKVSVQAFNDEDPQGRRTLGLFLHRRKAETTEHLRKVHMYVDSREKITARYQLICPSKRELMVFGSLKQPGTLLPKAPKGWGWRTALLFDELPELLQGGSLRIAAVVQLI